MNQENRKSKWDWLADRPLDQLFSEALDHVGRRYYNGERKWKEKERPALAKRIRQARNHNPREYDFAVLTKMIKESELVRERYFFIHTSEFAWVAMAAEDAKQELQALKAELSDLGILREKIKAASDELEKRERIFARIEELWSGADIRERNY